MAAKDNTMVITRKIALIPVVSERKEWKKRINAFLEKDFQGKLKQRRSRLRIQASQKIKMGTSCNSQN